MNKADEKALGGLHGKLAEVLKDAITEGVMARDKDGNVVLGKDGQPLRDPAPAAILNVARQFLKDNKIEAIAVQGSPLHDLADLPIFDDENVVPMYKQK